MDFIAALYWSNSLYKDNSDFLFSSKYIIFNAAPDSRRE